MTQMMLNKATIAAQAASAKSALSDANLKDHSAAAVDTQAELNRAQTEVANGVVLLNSAQRGLIDFNEQEIRSRIAKNLMDMGLTAEQSKKVAAETDLIKMQRVLLALGVPKAQFEASMYGAGNKSLSTISGGDFDPRSMLDRGAEGFGRVIDKLYNGIGDVLRFNPFMSHGQSVFGGGNSAKLTYDWTNK